MKANRTHTMPPQIEYLGDETYYYNFNIVKTVKKTVDGESYNNYDYEQVRLSMPVSRDKIQTTVNEAGFKHTVKLIEG